MPFPSKPDFSPILVYIDRWSFNLFVGALVFLCVFILLGGLAVVLFSVLEAGLDAWASFYTTFERMFLR